MKGLILIAAGGTGGHLFPAYALAGELMRRGYAVDLATDERADRYGEKFPGREIHIIASDTLRGRSPLALARTVAKLGRGTLQALSLLRKEKPKVIVGFGGYPTFPPMFAGFLSRVPTILHEANAVMGRANRMLASRARAVALGIAPGGKAAASGGRFVLTGNPVRDGVRRLAGAPYAPPAKDGMFRLLVFGGSQGARFFSEVLPAALALLPPERRSRIELVQQCRPEDLERVRNGLKVLGMEAELAPFYKDMADRIAASHLVISRSGASTVTELAVIGRPSILVPFPLALDNDQGRNAEMLSQGGGAIAVAQADMTPGHLATLLEDYMDAPEKLAAAAKAALTAGEPRAVEQLADLVEHIAGGGAPDTFQKGTNS
ncbi:undecaprenyldiphospho-muramoylpentapeptide beta-N-acetylglucosaminyltransferase [Stappia sp. F7233]|uniref:UDP-N-acetylglucosamine--N-acetylmuramyl-(pentapeptide) pyrophosphoryl-undecaprenol N-acetylglucosamine transferase n=1 Tax=Stappia albiluteola TaxID=2758565 RepID=A0A839AGB6_9HYPH|nr:undecaprenyldiphospho-muramoylpentapeptide beta-N-acetylglucosaminyltransferase [Stappia albiluteola]MBA5777807.1 undecaprenyldiphospho-muramoylpentapeptide beta-N-acetylglucosaminyltransferase [Stappia albiluteola]